MRTYSMEDTPWISLVLSTICYPVEFFLQFSYYPHFLYLRNKKHREANQHAQSHTTSK